MGKEERKEKRGKTERNSGKWGKEERKLEGERS
jgi:hypothetical protein